MEFLLNLIFPHKCVLCQKVLEKDETDLCQHCRTHAPEFLKAKRSIPFVARWTALWYYKDDVRLSIRRFKFRRFRSYASIYGRLLGMHLLETPFEDFDIISWVPVGPLRKWKRGFDQSQLLTNALAAELGKEPVHVLRKIRNTPPQSLIPDAAKRRANVLGAYQVTDKERIRGKRILLLDDVITTGATCSECAKTLLTAGAKEVFCAAVAAAAHDKK